MGYKSLVMADEKTKALTCEEAGRIGGLTSAKILTPEQRRESARRAARARWNRRKPNPNGDGGGDGGGGGLHATLAGAVEYGPNGEVIRQVLRKVRRKPAQPDHSTQGAVNDAA